MELLRVAASTDGVATRDFTRVKGVILVAGSDAASASIFDAETQAGTAKVTIKAPAADTRQIDFEGCVPFKSGISVTLTGTSPVLYLMVE